MAKFELATLGGGCFWCLEAVFQRVEGVIEVSPGYAGGHSENPTYKEVCNGATGHAEVVQIRFDAQIIDYVAILDWFWRCHDPTQKNRQGADVGTQYRSTILYHDEFQRDAAFRSMEEANQSGWFKQPIVTEIKALDRFYLAEPEHRNYYATNQNAPYCRLVITPKLQSLEI